MFNNLNTIYYSTMGFQVFFVNSITFNAIFIYLVFTEQKPAFKTPLMDVTANEKDLVKMECEVNRPKLPVRWFKDGKEITPNKRIEIVSDGLSQQLVIDDVTLDDMGTYVCMCGDASTEATLTVEGRLKIWVHMYVCVVINRRVTLCEFITRANVHFHIECICDI